MYPTVIGSEIEYCLLARDRAGRAVEPLDRPELQKEFLVDCMPEGLKAPGLDYTNLAAPETMSNNNHFLPNAARFYIDTGYHPEFAAAEGLGPRYALIHQKAGDVIVERVVARANERWRDYGFFLRLFKNNFAFARVPQKVAENYEWPSLPQRPSPKAAESYGAHESYLVLRNDRTSPASLRVKWAPFLISRILFSGNGMVRQNPKSDRVEYLLSQRASFMAAVEGGATTSSRTIINTRDEPHCGPELNEKYRRIHLIIGDSLTIEPALYLQLATTAMVLDMIESGFYPDGSYPGFEEASDLKRLDALRVFNEDSSLRASAELGGATYTAISLQEIYRDMAYRYFEQNGKLSEVIDVFHLWNKMITLAKSPRPHEALRKWVEWAAKKFYMEKSMDRLGCGWDTSSSEIVRRSERLHKRSGKVYQDSDLFNHLAAIDFQFHECSPRGIARVLIAAGEVERMVSDAEIEIAVFKPCPGTRATARYLQLRWLKELAQRRGISLRMDMDWERTCARASSEEKDEFNNFDPFGEDPHLP